jgi:phosphoglycolate phosphatase-like HAD superfamily hydrolase
MTKNVKGLLDALQQSINEAILESNDVAAAMAALKRTGKCPVFSIEVALDEAPVPADEPVALSALTEELVLSDADVEFLAAIGITDPSWCCSTPKPGTA